MSLPCRLDQYHPKEWLHLMQYWELGCVRAGVIVSFFKGAIAEIEVLSTELIHDMVVKVLGNEESFAPSYCLSLFYSEQFISVL